MGGEAAVSDLEFGIRVRADTGGVAGQIGELEDQVDQLGQTTQRTNQNLDRSGAGAASRQMRDLADNSKRAAEAQQEVQRSTQAAGAANAQAAGNVDLHRVAVQQLGFQISDVFTQLASGTNPLLVMAQQGPQIQQAFQLMQQAGSSAGKGLGEAAEGATKTTTALEAVTSKVGEAKEAYEQASGTIETLTGALGVGTAAESESTAAKAANTTATTSNSAATRTNTGATSTNTAATETNAAATTAAGGAKARFAAILAGPYTGAILAAVSVLGILGMSLLNSEESTEKLTDAQELQKMKLEELRQAILDEAEALEQGIQTTRESMIARFEEAELHRQEIIRRRQNTVAALEEARAIHEANIARASRGGAGQQDSAGNRIGPEASRIAELERQLQQAKVDLNNAEVAVQRARIPVLRDAVEESSDPAAQIRGRFERGRRRLEEQLEQAVQVGGDRARAEQEYVDGLRRLTRTRLDEERTLRERSRRPRREREESLGDRAQRLMGEELLAAARRYQGLGEGRGAGQLQELMGIDPRTMAWCAAFLNGLLRQEGMSGTGSNMARSFLNWGAATDRPQAGDVVVLRDQSGRNSPTQGHVGLFVGNDRQGNVQVLGGNQSDQVRVSTFSSREVLGYRRAPTAAEGYEEEQRAAERARREAEQLAEWGMRASEQLRTLRGRFSPEPEAVVQQREALLDLDEILAEIEQRRPPNYEQLKRDAEAARPVIQDSINQPYREFVDSQQEALTIARMERQGLTAEAEARRIILGLERQMGPLGTARKEAVLATVQALQAEQREMEILREQQQMYLSAIGDVRSMITDTLQAGLGGDLKALLDLPDRLRKAFNQLVAEYLTDRLFGGVFRELQDQVTGTNIVRDASTRMAGSMDVATGAVTTFTDALVQAGLAVARQGAPVAGAGTTGAPAVARDPRRFFEDMIAKLAEGVFGRRAAESIGRVVTQGLEGAAYGSLVSGVLNQVGIKTNGTGAAIGGALGNVAGKALEGTLTAVLGKSLGSLAGPLGSVLGSIAGGLIGNVISGHQKGSATITNISGDPSAWGKTTALSNTASGLAGAVQDGLARIAEQLGGAIGSFKVSIGVRDGTYRVDPLGRGQTKAPGVLNFGEDQAAAIAAAIMDAIKDGAVTGLSAAVQRALKSSSDLNKALAEAVKVSEVETLLKGSVGSMEKMLRDFERQASERVRIAKQYGFDLVKLEEVNAKERAKIFDEALRSKVGQLQVLLDDLKFGDLFEGSITDRRQLLLAEIAKEETKAKAGEEGAADRVAQLRRDLLELTRGGFGTAGEEFASDRAGTVSAAEEIIRLENERLKEARDGTNARLDTNNRLTDETNNLLAEQNALLRGVLGGGGDGAGSGGRSQGFSSPALPMPEPAKTIRFVDLGL
jgi:uncharacterized protein (TIGR02594 family)